MKRIFLLLIAFFAFSNLLQTEAQPTPQEKDGTQLIKEMVAAMGGINKYRELKDVTYAYTYRDMTNGKQDVSTEKYLYDGELSWGEYHIHTKNVSPDKKGPVTQAWNGHEAWLIVEGNFIPAPPALRMVNFARNTSFFWFNMMYKMLDPGTIHKLLPNRKFDDQAYKIVEVTYEKGVGDAQDRFVLYINPETKLVEHFLFSNAFFGPNGPIRMMHIEFQEVDGLKFPKRQWYETADWEGNLIAGGPPKSEKIYTELKFNTGIEKSLFDKPILMNIPLADIRNDYLKKGIKPEDKTKGKDLIQKLEAACGGYDTWKSYTTGHFTQTADWYDNETNWTTNPQQFELSCTIGGSDGQLTLLNGPKKGMTWQIRDGVTYAQDGKMDKEHHQMVWHKQDFKSYWFQFPFRIREADIIAYAGQRAIEGTNYDIVYATWHSEAPNSKYDQFMLYLHPDTHLLEWLEFTIRDIFPMATGTSQFANYQENASIRLPMSQFITQGTLDKPGKKMHENHYQEFSFKK